MSDINLLQNQLSSESSVKSARLLDKIEIILFTLLFLVLLASAGLFIWNELSERRQGEVAEEISQRKVTLESTVKAQRDLVIKTQAQMQYLAQLLPLHPYWTNFLKILNSSSLNGIRITELSAGSTGATLSGLARDFDTMLAFSKTLNSKEGIERVVVNSVSLSNDQGVVSYQFSMEVGFDFSLLNYNPDVN